MSMKVQTLSAIKNVSTMVFATTTKYASVKLVIWDSIVKQLFAIRNVWMAVTALHQLYVRAQMVIKEDTAKEVSFI